MPIKFRCPNPECNKPLSVKDELAGKRAACPACKKPLTIPKPVKAADVESLAMAAFAETAKEAVPAAAPTFVKMECPMCAEEVEFPAAEAGKRAQCPKCRNLIKVNELKVEKPKDWRQVGSDGKPMGAKRENQEPEGAWGTNVSRGKVSRESLEEAGAIPDTAPPVSVATWVKRGALAAGAIVVLVAGIFGIMAAVSSGRQKQVIAQALEKVEDQNGKMIAGYPDHLAAALYRSVGEVYLRERKADKAKEYLSKARARASLIPADNKALTVERDALLIEIALLQIDLGGTEEQAMDKTHLEWEPALGQVRGTLLAMSCPEAKTAALRDVNARFVLEKNDDKEKRFALFNALDSQKDVEKAAAVALALERGKADEVKDLVPPPEEGKPINDRAARLGYAEGYALQKDFPKAMAIAGAPGGQPLHKFESLLAVATVAQQRGHAAEFEKALAEAIQLNATQGKTFKIPCLHYQLVRLMVRSPNQAANAKAVAEEDPLTKARGQLEIFRKQLERPGPAAVNDHITERDSMAYAQAIEALAQRTTRLQSSGAALEGLEGLPENLRPFIHSGIALGTVRQKSK